MYDSTYINYVNFLEASSGTKKKVFLKVAEKGNKEQLELIKSVSASVW